MSKKVKWSILGVAVVGVGALLAMGFRFSDFKRVSA